MSSIKILTSSFSSFALAFVPRMVFVVVIILLLAELAVVPGIVVTTVGTDEFIVPLLLLLKILAGGFTGDCNKGEVNINCLELVELASKYLMVVAVGCWVCGLAAMVSTPEGDDETVDDDVVLIRSESTEVAEAAASASASRCPPVLVLMVFVGSSDLTMELLGSCATS